MTLHFRTCLSLFLTALFLLPGTVSAATLSLFSADNLVNAGDSFTETIIVLSVDQALNAVSGTLSFPADLLEVISISKTGSILSLWLQDPSFSNSNGSITWGGIVPNPGYIGERGQIFSVQFRAKKEGVATIDFSSSAVLANDGNGTNILTSAESSVVTISGTAQSQPEQSSQPPISASDGELLARITSSTHPDETKWYKSSHVVFDWTNAEGVSAVLLGCDKNPNGKPSVLYSDPISHKELDLTDGIWYFHVQEKRQGGWGPISTYKIQIDTIDGILLSSAPPRFTFSDAIFLATLVVLLLAIGYINVHFLIHHRRRSNPKLNLMRTHIHKKFVSLKDAITEEMLTLERTRPKRTLTHEEERLIIRFKKLLDQSERIIEKDIEDTQK